MRENRDGALGVVDQVVGKELAPLHHSSSLGERSVDALVTPSHTTSGAPRAVAVFRAHTIAQAPCSSRSRAMMTQLILVLSVTNVPTAPEMLTGCVFMCGSTPVHPNIKREYVPPFSFADRTVPEVVEGHRRMATVDQT